MERGYDFKTRLKVLTIRIDSQKFPNTLQLPICNVSINMIRALGEELGINPCFLIMGCLIMTSFRGKVSLRE